MKLVFREVEWSPEKLPKRRQSEKLVKRIGICGEKVEILGQCDKMVTLANFTIDAYVGYIKDFDMSQLRLSENEVGEVFTVPLEFFYEK